ncbi:GTPase [Methanocella sp. CWC-04]|uniref:GTPase n=1 Tax=Methanooceanicella nereidis TaxID=2052831 RepID=A0AAP2RBG1_9EURY|nr:GTP-binding protein [Methanocella sp. CWC-04]MCD1294481.1 GTPase [Methanocella sp. CWC-04]
MIKTGIPTLDGYLKGGLPIGKTIIFYGPPTVDVDIFGMQVAYTNLINNGVCYYVTSKSSPDLIRSNFREYGWDLIPYASRFAIVDAYSSLIGASPTEPFNVKDPESIESIDDAMTGIIDSISPGDMIVFSSLSSILDTCGGGPGIPDINKVLESIKRWNKMAVLNGGIVVYNFTDYGYPPELVEQVKKGLCNSSVVVDRIGGESGYGQYFKLYTCDWSKPPEFPTLFKVVKPGGIKVHIPKILVTGPKGAGKSTFIRSAASLSSDKSVSVDRMGTTVAVDYAHVMLKGFTIDMFGTPGQDRFNPIIKNIAKDALGIIVVIDSTDPKSFERAVEMLNISKTKDVPYIIAANKQDLEDALDTEKIRKKINLPEDIPIVRVSASNNMNVAQAIDIIIKKIVGVR